MPRDRNGAAIYERNIGNNLNVQKLWACLSKLCSIHRLKLMLAWKVTFVKGQWPGG